MNAARWGWLVLVAGALACPPKPSDEVVEDNVCNTDSDCTSPQLCFNNSCRDPMGTSSGGSSGVVSTSSSASGGVSSSSSSGSASGGASSFSGGTSGASSSSSSSSSSSGSTSPCLSPVNGARYQLCNGQVSAVPANGVVGGRFEVEGSVEVSPRPIIGGRYSVDGEVLVPAP